MGEAKAAADRVERARPGTPAPPERARAGPLLDWGRTRGLDDRARSYPRAGGVVVPPELARFCEGIVAPSRTLTAKNDAAVELAASAGRAVVQRMARITYALPRPLLELRLPGPAVVLQTYVLDERTRRVLERAAPLTNTRTWTLAAYLAVPRFGPFCLVDLLSARAEAAAGLPSKRAGRRARIASRLITSDEPGRAPRVLPLDDVSTMLMRAMPLGGDQVRALLDLEGSAPTVRELARAYRCAGRTVPFRVVRHGGCEVVVAPSVRNVARTVLVAATQFISWWGLTTVQQIVSRAQLRAASAVSVAFAARVLASLPKVVWLDPGREWFSFRDNRSALLRAIRSAFVAAERVELPSLARALAKEKPFLALTKLPDGVWERYLAVVAGCTVEGSWVRCQLPDSPCRA